MKRLFISLYVVVVMALVLIGWSSEKLWQLLQSSSDNEVAQMATLSRALLLVPELGSAEQQRKLSEVLGHQVSLLSLEDIAWPEDQLSQLNNQEPVLTFDAQDQLSIFLLIDDQLLHIGPISITNSDNTIARSLYFVSYLLLAVVIGLWSWPLWRDLTVLQRSTALFGQGQWQQLPQVSKHSVIAPVVDTFKQAAARIARLVTEQKELTNAVSHELRTPLSRLKFSIALLELDENPKQQPTPQALKGMKEDINELEALVDEMLSYSRLESEAKALVLVTVNLNELLNNLGLKLSKNTDKVIEVKCNDSVHWCCDGHFIERAMQNLITNALRYAKQTVLVTIERQQEWLVLSVEDDGGGIDSDNKTVIFKPFVRLDKSRGKDNGGFGLGLAIVKRIADWHQGRVEVADSSLGGAKFSLKLPHPVQR